MRAADTAGSPAERLNVEPEEDALADGFDREDALELLGAPRRRARVLVVGHEPSFSQVVYDLTGAPRRLQEGRRRRDARVAAPSGELIAMLRPRELESLASGDSRLAALRTRASATAARGCSELGDELLGVVRGAAARPEAVDRQRDRAAKWLRRWRRRAAAATTGRPSARARALEQRRGRPRRPCPGQRRTISGSQARAADLGRDRVEHALEGVEVSARMSQTSSPSPGTTLNASPECSTVGTAVRRSGPSGRGRRRRPARRRRARAARCGRGRARSRSATRGPRRATRSVPAALRRTTTPSSPSGVRSPASKHRQASQPAKRSTWPNGAVRHSSSQTSSSATSA